MLRHFVIPHQLTVHQDPSNPPPPGPARPLGLNFDLTIIRHRIELSLRPSVRPSVPFISLHFGFEARPQRASAPPPTSSPLPPRNSIPPGQKVHGRGYLNSSRLIDTKRPVFFSHFFFPPPPSPPNQIRFQYALGDQESERVRERASEHGMNQRGMIIPAHLPGLFLVSFGGEGHSTKSRGGIQRG